MGAYLCPCCFFCHFLMTQHLLSHRFIHELTMTEYSKITIKQNEKINLGIQYWVMATLLFLTKQRNNGCIKHLVFAWKSKWEKKTKISSFPPPQFQLHHFVNNCRNVFHSYARLLGKLHLMFLNYCWCHVQELWN